MERVGHPSRSRNGRSSSVSCRSPRFTLLDGGENEYAPEEVELATMYRADRTAYQEAYTNDEDSRVINPSVESKNKKEADKWAEAALYGPPEQWVIVFDVPENAAKFTLELKPSFFGSSDHPPALHWTDDEDRHRSRKPALLSLDLDPFAVSSNRYLKRG